MHFSASSQWSKICFGYQGIIINGKKGARRHLLLNIFSEDKVENGDGCLWGGGGQHLLLDRCSHASPLGIHWRPGKISSNKIVFLIFRHFPQKNLFQNILLKISKRKFEWKYLFFPRRFRITKVLLETSQSWWETTTRLGGMSIGKYWCHLNI